MERGNEDEHYGNHCETFMESYTEETGEERMSSGPD